MSSIKSRFFSHVAAGVAGVLVFALCAYALAGHDAVNSLERYARAIRYRTIIHLDEVDTGLIAAIRANCPTRDDIPLYCNNLIYDNSVKENDLEFNANIPLITKRLGRLLKGEQVAKVPVKCDSRALALMAMVKKFGFYARLVHFLGYSKPDEFVGHTVMEVEMGGTWRLFDPYYGLTFTLPDGRPAGTVDVVTRGVDEVVPVSPLGRGWDENAPRANKKGLDSLYCIAVYDNRFNGEKSVALVNLARIRRVTQGKVPGLLADDLLQYINKNWIDPVVINL